LSSTHEHLPLPEAELFAHFLRRIRAGDEKAAEELVHRYEPVIRREVRMRLTDPSLYRLFDSMDICQSVLQSFFVRAAAGQYELNEPADLLKLLVTMARNKVATQARRVKSRPQDNRRGNVDHARELANALNGPDPVQIIAGRDLLQEVMRRLPAEERKLAELRGQRLSWPEIAARLGGSAEARRKQLTRALDRVARQLGLDQDL
jgi:RNA polymerase sigma factor (sigma-70 family)